MNNGQHNVISVLAGAIDFNNITEKYPKRPEVYDRAYDVTIKASNGQVRSTNWLMLEKINGATTVRHTVTGFQIGPKMNVSDFTEIRHEVAAKLFNKGNMGIMSKNAPFTKIICSKGSIYFDAMPAQAPESPSSGQILEAASEIESGKTDEQLSPIAAKLKAAMEAKGEDVSSICIDTEDTLGVKPVKPTPKPAPKPTGNTPAKERTEAIVRELATIPVRKDDNKYSMVFGYAGLKRYGKPVGMSGIITSARMVGANFDHISNPGFSVKNALAKLDNVVVEDGVYSLKDWDAPIPEPTTGVYIRRKRMMFPELFEPTKSPGRPNPDTVPNPNRKSNDFANGASSVIITPPSDTEAEVTDIETKTTHVATTSTTEAKMLKAINKLITENGEYRRRLNEAETAIKRLEASVQSNQELEAENERLRNELEASKVDTSALDQFLDN